MLKLFLDCIKNNIIILINLKSILKENKNRLGYCNKCGWICCQKGCPFISKTGCKIYFIRPLTCRLAPIKKDYIKHKWKEQGCTYLFKSIVGAF